MPPVWVRRSASRGNSSKTRSRSCWNAADLRSLRAYAPMSRFSSTVIPGKMPRPSGDWQIPIVVRWWAGMRVMSWPSNMTRPPAVLRIPESIRSVVDLPAPLAPISVTISPSSTWKEMPLSASIRP